MLCPYCNFDESNVLESRDAQEGKVRVYTRAEVEAAVNKAFLGADRAEALGYLDLNESALVDAELERTQMAIIDLSEGSLDRLVRFADYAYRGGHREVGLWSECPTCRPIGIPVGL